MNFRFNEEETAAAELARKILQEKVSPERLKELEASGDQFESESWKILAESQLLGLCVPEEYGGTGLGFMALCLLCQEVGRTVSPVPVHASLVLGALPLVEFGSRGDVEAWLPGILSGDVILTAALSELDSSDPMVPTTEARRIDGGFCLSGEKTSVPWALQAARILIPAMTEAGGIVLAWVSPDKPGLRSESQALSDRQPYGYLALDQVEISDSDVLVGPESGEKALRWLVERATVARCATQLGVIERALEMTAEYGRERIQFDRPIGSFQAFHQRAADAYIMIEALRLSLWEAAWQLSKAMNATQTVAVAKYWAAEGAQFAAYACQHLHGGVGIDVDYPLHRYFIWATQIEHELGAAPHQLEKLGNWIAAEIDLEF